MPNPLGDTAYVWIPAGLLEDGDQLEIVSHLCVASRAPWDTVPLQGMCYDDVPDLPEFIALLRAADA